MRRILNASCMVIAIFVAGCMSHQYGTKIDSNKVSQIKKGVTTKAEVEALLGAPSHAGITGDGRRMMTYSYTESSSQASFIPFGGASGKSRTQTLQIMISKSGVVEDYEFSDNAQDHETGGFLGIMNMKSTPSQK